MEDAFFKTVFSHPRMIELLIRSQIPNWADAIDYSSLQRLPGEFVDDRLRHRFADRVWRGQSLDAGTEYILVLEFQGRPERHMALRTTVYSGLAVQELLRHDKELARGDRDLAVACLVLYHGDRPWNAPTRLRYLFRDSAPDTYQVVSRRPPATPPPTPLDLPQLLLGLAGLSRAQDMQAELRVLQRVVRDCEDDDLDQFLTQAVKAWLSSKGMSSTQLEEAMTMQTVATAFERSLDEIRQEGREQGIRQGREHGIRQGREQGIRQGREQGIRQGREQGIELGRVSILRQLAARKFGPVVAEELVKVLKGTPDPECVARATEALLDCDAADDFVKRVRAGGR
ncbi:MAG: Rpn family recombination-promoting nuclease/putative transposase [Gemmatimonadetes bacterium]|nr:Rpn family recombination-promoting nuclease/putative transposase [Gemmatimonadota bacterium]